MKPLLVIVVIAVLVLHHDIWNWTNKTLVMGFLPIGLAYHIGYAIVASLTMALLVKFAWPSDIEDEALASASQPPSGEVEPL
jgi:hypothetical protein